MDANIDATMLPQALRQRGDYTHKHNLKSGRHGWLRLTPAYSLKLVEEILSGIPTTARVLDPFCGTGTTALCAAFRSHEATTVEINPFLVWLSSAKLARYSDHDIQAAREAAHSALSMLCGQVMTSNVPPPIHNVGRWWGKNELRFLCSLKPALELSGCGNKKVRDLLMVAFCRTLIKLSNAAFNHQSMSFKDYEVQQQALFDGAPAEEIRRSLFAEDLEFVLQSAADNPNGNAVVVHGDSRNIGTLLSGPFDVVVTSPPYPNRISYIRELRPYMYWLEFLVDARDAADMDWASIGGTWGVATSRLKDWRPSGFSFCPNYLVEILAKIADEDNASGKLLSNYVGKYFEDMFCHLSDLRSTLSHGARVHYIVGNSTFYDVLLPVERLYADMMHSLGFSRTFVRPVRKRNSKKALVEFDVSAQWE